MLYSYKARSTGLFFIFCIAYGIIMLNLYITQISNQSFYQDLKNKQYYVTITTMPTRGTIVDRTGTRYLALNKDSICAFIMPKNISSPETLLPFLEKHFPKARERFDHQATSHFMYVQRRLTPEQIQLIEESQVPDIKFLQEPSRYYPIPSLGPLIGITDIDNKGLFGLELQYNELLAGSPATVTLARDARTRHFYFSKETKMEGKEGNPLTLTIDGTLQYIVYEELSTYAQRLQAKEAAALIIDPTTGDILAMVNVPDFDANKPETAQQETTKNNIITDTYELGSVIKVFSTLAALQEKVVSADEIIDCKNTKTAYIDGRKINTVYPGGQITFSQVVEQSNNIGIAQVTKRLGTKLYDHYVQLGFGSKTNIPFPGEQKGFVNPPHLWSKQSLISLSYGYEIRCSLLQLAKAFCIIARDGYDGPLNIVLNPRQQPATHNTNRLYDHESIDTMKDILERTTRKRRWKKSPLDAYRVMCKTGTAEILENGEYNRSKNIFTCAGIIEHRSAHNHESPYQRVIVVFIKEIPQKNVYAATIAGPLFDTIAEKLVIHDKAL